MAEKKTHVRAAKAADTAGHGKVRATAAKVKKAAPKAADTEGHGGIHHRAAAQADAAKGLRKPV